MMATSSPRKRPKALIKELWQLQRDDVPMTAATFIEVKYLLRNFKSCLTVEIETPKPRANVMDPSPFTIAEEAIPKFVWCQLLDQKLIESRNYQDTIALPAALSVISLTYSTGATIETGRYIYPTQFRWHCSRTHRSHLIFAHVDFKMRSRVYTVEELLTLKNASSPDVLAAVAFRDNELAEMLRTKSRVSSRSYNSSSLKRGPRKTMDDSSTNSDEIVFKGTIGRRSQRPEIIPQNPPIQPVEGDQSAHPVQQTPLAVQHTSSNQANAKATGGAAAESDQPLEWKYRGRSGSEVTASEPLPAPTGAAAQQNEGFQRFYKAVISPTHVRVTAGGRIVPNTRNPVSPTAKRPRDGEIIASGTPAEPAPAAAPAAAPKQPIPVMGMPHPMQYFHPGFYPGMPPIHPMTGMPMPMMPPGYPFSMPQMPNAAMAAGAQDTKENFTKKIEDKDTKSAPEPAIAKNGIKLSPPEHFDHSKPFMYNGQQWMFPMFPTPFPGYMGMGPQAFAGPQVPGASMMMPPHMAMPQMMGSMGPMGVPAPQAPMPPPPAPAAARQPTPQPPSKPPISSIRPSQITRKQIDGLRANLKYHEDQLQFNKHQIDEKDMENKIQLLNNDIQRFEQVFKAQAEYEEKHYPKSDKAKEDASSSGRSSSAAPSTKTSQSQSEESKESKESKATTVTVSSQPKLRKKERSRDSIGLNSNKSSTASYPCEDAARVGFSGTNPGRKSTLPSGAALAPVFQPRSASGVSAFTVPITKSKNWEQDNTVEQPSQEQLEDTDQKLREAGTTTWSQAQVSNPASQHQSPCGHDNLGVPYLIGTLPQGIKNSYPQQRIDYEYSRKLTDEELQARHLYFGKAPRAVSQGLPKYDGRNFYPPSPVKNNDSPSVRRQRIATGVPKTDYGLPVANGKDGDPFRAITPSDASSRPGKADNNKTPSSKSTHSLHSQAEDKAAEFADALAETAVEDDAEGTHSKDVSQTRSADYHDSRTNGAASKLWQNMFKRGLTSSDVLPNTVSSTTAQGFLPQFAGHAAASLSPTLTSPTRNSPPKGPEITCNGTSTFMTQKTAENRPPATVTAPGERLSDTLLNMVGIKAPAWAT